MSVAMTRRRMTREEFFGWSQVQRERYEFDGFQPVAMTGGNINHNRICHNIYDAVRPRLKAGTCELLGPDAGVATVGEAVRYPDAVIGCSQTSGLDYLVTAPVVVFEVLSVSSSRLDRIDKVREYGAVPSILRYVIVERTSAAMTVLSRADGAERWSSTVLVAGDVLDMPEIGIEVAVAEFYEDVDLPPADAPGSD